MVQLSEFLAFAKGKEFDHEDPWDTVFMETIPDSEVSGERECEVRAQASGVWWDLGRGNV